MASLFGIPILVVFYLAFEGTDLRAYSAWEYAFVACILTPTVWLMQRSWWIGVWVTDRFIIVKSWWRTYKIAIENADRIVVEPYWAVWTNGVSVPFLAMIVIERKKSRSGWPLQSTVAFKSSVLDAVLWLGEQTGIPTNVEIIEEDG